MAIATTSGQGVQQLTQELFSTSIWNCMRNMNESVYANIGALCRVGLAIGFFCMCLQILFDLVTQTYGQGIHPFKSIRKTLLKVLFAGLLLVPFNYKFVTVNVIAKPCDLLAEAITLNYTDKFVENVSGMFDVFGESAAKKQSIFTSAFWEQLSSSFIASIVYIVAAALTYIAPLLQSVLFLFAFYLGPLCIPFMICDFTSSIAQRWLSFIMATSFMSVVGAITFLITDTADLAEKMKNGGGWENVFIVLVYGILQIILYSMAFPIASFLFNAQGAVGGAIANPAAVVNKSSDFTRNVSSIGAGQIGKQFEKAGSKALAAGNVAAAEKNFGRAESSYGFASSMQVGGRDQFQSKAKSMSVGSSGSRSEKAGYEALKSGDTQTASNHFAQASKNYNSASTLQSSSSNREMFSNKADQMKSLAKDPQISSQDSKIGDNSPKV